jgi:tRNA (guanosine-2'-O-)-methyltransferase
MRRHWSRWRGYVDEIEEAMRMAGEQLAEVEALVAERYERSDWRRPQAQSVSAELVRRALDIPFLRELVQAARKTAEGALPASPDFDGRTWREGETRARLASSERFPGHPDAPAAPPPHAEAQPPARLRAAERALVQRTRSLVVVLDELVSARNASAVVRTTDALGLQELHLIASRGRVHLERTVTMLAQRWLDLFWYERAGDAIAGLRERGYRILVSDFGPDARPVDEVPLGARVALVFGSEQRGVSDAVREQADGLFYLPTCGFTSYLNVSVAAGISLYAIDRRMHALGLRQPLEAEDLRELRRAWYTALARGDRERARRHLAWLEHPPEPSAGSRSSRPR